MATCNDTTTSSLTSRSIVGHYIIIWLDSNTTHANENTKNSFDNIRQLVHSIKIFISIDECGNFLQTIKNKQIFIIIADSFEQEQTRLYNLIEETIQIHSVYVFSNDPLKEKHWETECKKLKGIFTKIELICDALEQNIRPSEIIRSTTIVTTVDDNLDELDQSYMYSKLLTEIIFKIEYDTKARQEAFDICRKSFSDNSTKLTEVDTFEQDYETHSPIWWYTKESPISSLLRDALITQDIDMMITLGFFMRDLHQAIKKAHVEMNQTEKIIVYRGQGMLNDDFQKFIQRKGGLHVFHNFISTSTNRETGLHFVRAAALNTNCTAILFQIEIDPTICLIPFASLDKTSYYAEAENEILFSTHTIFRIGEIDQDKDGLWTVNLTLTNEVDEQMSFLIHHTRNEIRGVTGWHSLATFLYKMGKYNRAIEIFDRITEITSDDNEQKFMNTLASTYNNIGLMYDAMDKYSNALAWYEKAHEVQTKSLAADHPSFAVVYSNMAMVHRSMGDYTQALSCCEKTLAIRSKLSSSDHRSLTIAYSNMGMIYESKGDYAKALSYYEQAYEIQKSSLPPRHPSFTLSYNNLGGIYSLMGKYPIALSHYENTIEIQGIALPPDHPSVAITYSNIGHVYQLMGNYGISLSYYNEALAIQEKIFPSSNSLSLATTYNNIGLLYRLMENYPTALSYYEKTLKIEVIFLPEDHPTLASTYNNLGAVHQSMGEHTVALTHYKKTLGIWQKCLPPNHSSLATIYNNIGSVYDSMKDYKQALSYYDKTIEIQLKLPSSNQLDLASTYNNMGEAYRSMGEYLTALSYYQKTLEIEQKDLSTNHPSLAITLSNMAVAFNANNQLEEACEHAGRALDILCHSLGLNHAQTKETKKFLDSLRQKLSPQT